MSKSPGMNFTRHALDKLKLYAIDPGTVQKSNVIHRFYDTTQSTAIHIVRIAGVLFALVIDPNTENLITIYRTDQKTIDNRQKAKRWI